MKRRGVTSFVFVILFYTSFLSFAQEKDTILSLEDQQIAFQEHFFNALKYKAIGSHSKAIQELEQTLPFLNDTLLATVNSEFAKNYMALHKYEQATYYVQQSLVTDPTNYWHLEQAKLIYLNQYDYAKAIEIQQQIISLKPRLKEDLVLIYIKANDYKSAKKVIEELEADKQMTAKLTSYKNIVFKREQAPKKKSSSTIGQDLVSLKKAYATEKKYSLLKRILELEFQNQNFKGAFPYVKEGVELFPAQPHTYLYYAVVLVQDKKYQDALDYLDVGIDFIVDDIKLLKKYYQLYALANGKLNRLEKEKLYKQKALDLQ